MQIENTPTERIHESFNAQRIYFDEGNTKDIEFRKTQLRRLKSVIKRREEDVVSALSKDMGKPKTEAFGSELGLVYRELDFMLKNIDQLDKEERRKTPVILKPSTSSIMYEPKGIILIISPWNYPIHLTLTPLIGAIAAGNTVIVKPSEMAYHSSKLVEEIIEESFDTRQVFVLQGEGSKVIPELMENHRLDHVLFTGSAAIGKKIAKMAAAHLTPVTLELGGKSPAIIDKSANIRNTAKKIVWGKFFNAGQTCIAPDYVIVHESVRDELLTNMKMYIQKFFGDKPVNSENYARMISSRHLKSVHRLLEGQEVYYGGGVNEDQRYIEPTIVLPNSWESPIMQTEIFGPILPVVSWKEKGELLEYLRKNRYPLASYIFTGNSAFEHFILKNNQFGSACVNDTLVHLASEHLPFGGIGTSGYGRYRGWASLKLFSNEKSILRSSSWFDPPIRYPDYSKLKLDIIKRVLRW